nr:MAG TPA: hypothetical protein [Caudoviricetes sp.]
MATGRGKRLFQGRGVACLLFISSVPPTLQ